MSMALQNQVDTLEEKVKKLTEQVEQLSRGLKPISPEILRPKRKYTRHIQPQ